MAKEIPYFRFYPGEWFAGDIVMLDMETRAVFIELCAYYWQKDCDITLSRVNLRFSKWQANVNLLLTHGIFTVDNDENLTIQFLDEQYGRALDVSRKRSKQGRLGGIAKGKQKVSKSKAIDIYKDKDKDKDNIKSNGVLKDVVDYLNFVTGKNFSHTTAETIKHINGRINEGRTLEDFKTVIDRKYGQWVNDKKMNQFLRPNTLFNESKFDAYLNESDEVLGEGEEAPLTEEQKYEQVKDRFYAHWNKTGNLKDALDLFAGSPYVKKIYIEIKKNGLKKDDLVGKKPTDIIPGYTKLAKKKKI